MSPRRLPVRTKFRGWPGQRQETIVKALHDYQHGARRGRGKVIIPEIAHSLEEDDIKSIAHFMSRQDADAKP